MKDMIGKILFGNDTIKEYSTVTITEEIREQVFLLYENHTINISTNHWLLCLEPIVFGIWINKDQFQGFKTPGYSMYFTDQGNLKNEIARIDLELFEEIAEENGSLILLKFVNTKLHHLNSIQTWFLFHRYYKKPGLTFTKLRSYAAAYSYPRKVRIISFKENDYYNIFPMDLVGEISQNNKYVFGLRHSNQSLSRIIAVKKMVVSEAGYEHKNTIYDLGTHHGGGAPPVDSLPFKVIDSAQFGFPIPEWVESYKEIQIIKTLDLGSHMLLYGEVVNEVSLHGSSGNLFHIHFLLSLYHQRKKFSYQPV